MNSFSIIVPIYNVELYLDKCINSLIHQNYDNYEIILVNDGSTDNSKIIIDKYNKKYPNLIKSYTKKNGGLSSARNYGIDKSNNDYLLFIDSDDYIESNTLNILNKSINNKEDIIVFNYKAIINNEVISTNTFDKSILDYDKRFIISNPSACNKLIKKNLLLENNIRFENGIYYEDLAIIPRLIKYTKSIKFIDDYLYNYVVRDNSITNKTIYNKKMDDIFKVVKILNNELNNKYKEEIEYIYIEHLLRNAGIRFLNYKKYDKIKNINKIMNKEFPDWKNNKYYKTQYNIKQKIMCKLIYKEKYFLISLLRFKIGK